MKKIILTMTCVSALFVGLNSCKTTQNKAEVDKSAKVETKKAAVADVSDNSQLVGKRWTLVELNGKPVESKREAYLLLSESGNQVSGNLGCNGFSGMYELTAGNRIKFSSIVGTLKMCLNMEIEDELKRVFEIADNYYVNNDTLTLNRARMAPLAKFAVLVQ